MKLNLLMRVDPGITGSDAIQDIIQRTEICGNTMPQKK